MISLWLQRSLNIYSDFLSRSLMEYFSWLRTVCCRRLNRLLHKSLAFLKRFQPLSYSAPLVFCPLLRGKGTLLTASPAGPQWEPTGVMGSVSVPSSLLSYASYVCLSSLVVPWSHQPCQKGFPWDKREAGARWPLTCWQPSLNFFPWQLCAMEGLASNRVIFTSPPPCDSHWAKLLFKQLH